MQAIVTRIALYFIGASLILGIVGGAYYTWKRTIERQVELQFTVEQLKSAAAAVQKANEELAATLEIAREVQLKIEKERQEWEDTVSSIMAGIDAGEDRESSKVIKDTIRELSR